MKILYSLLIILLVCSLITVLVLMLNEMRKLSSRVNNWIITLKIKMRSRRFSKKYRKNGNFSLISDSELLPVKKYRKFKQIDTDFFIDDLQLKNVVKDSLVVECLGRDIYRINLTFIADEQQISISTTGVFIDEQRMDHVIKDSITKQRLNTDRVKVNMSFVAKYSESIK